MTNTINIIKECLPKLEQYQKDNPGNDITELVQILTTLREQPKDKNLLDRAVDGINKYISLYNNLTPIVVPPLVALSGLLN